MAHATDRPKPFFKYKHWSFVFIVVYCKHRYGEFKKRSVTTGLQLFKAAVDFPTHDPGLTLGPIQNKWFQILHLT